MRVLSGNVIARDFRGSFGMADVASGIHSIGIYGGRVVIESSCVGGEIHVRGDPFDIIDNSGPECNVVNETSATVIIAEIPTAAENAVALWDEIL